MNSQPGSGKGVSKGIAEQIEKFGYRLNYVTERLCGLLAAAMILVVWYGVFARYFLSSGGTWTEELARYIMIWTALLAVPCCTYRREHIGLVLLFSRLPENMQKPARLILDCIGLLFFIFLTYYGIGMAKGGATQFATIFRMNMVLPYLSVPISCGLTIIQILVCMSRDIAAVTPTYLTREPA